jgi:hypothetical protein
MPIIIIAELDIRRNVSVAPGGVLIADMYFISFDHVDLHLGDTGPGPGFQITFLLRLNR